MKSILKIISFLGLGLTIIPSFLVFAGQISFDLHKTIALIGTAMWILTAPFWINKKRTEEKSKA